MTKNIINNTQHVFISGSTGTGKTIIAKIYNANTKYHTFVLDTKGTFLFEPFVGEDDYILVYEFKNLDKASKKSKKIVYRPILEELTQEFYNEFFKYCYFKRNCTVIVDEAMQVIKNSFSIPEYYKGILTRGRELNVSVWSLTQRPSGINQLIMSEATHFFIFRLNHINDRKKIAEISGQDKFLLPPEGHEFIYWKADKSKVKKGLIKLRKDV